MCTVTFLPLSNTDFILTSNRDEDSNRKTIAPKVYEDEGVKLVYPKDVIAGGTWIGLSDKKRLICLLNGGFEKHKQADSYRLSRGVIVKELLKVDDPVEIINHFNFEGIEPFTIVLVDWKVSLNAYELVWDGVDKYFKKLDNKPKIWSSSTLYTNDQKQLRRDWFSEWLGQKNNFSQKEIINFHQDNTKGNLEISLRMKRSYVETVSITSVKKIADALDINYIDLLNNSITNIKQKQ